MEIKKQISVTINLSSKDLNELLRILNKCVVGMTNPVLEISFLENSERDFLKSLMKKLDE
jgi:hypothetical protein